MLTLYFRAEARRPTEDPRRMSSWASDGPSISAGGPVDPFHFYFQPKLRTSWTTVLLD